MPNSVAHASKWLPCERFFKVLSLFKEFFGHGTTLAIKGGLSLWGDKRANGVRGTSLEFGGKRDDTLQLAFSGTCVADKSRVRGVRDRATGVEHGPGTIRQFAGFLEQ
jgi:hypothetical protein